MRRLRLMLFLVLPCPVMLGGCVEEEPPEIISFSVEPTTVEAGGDCISTVEVHHFELTGEADHEHDEAGAGGEDHMGHVHIYLDDLMTNPVLMQVELVETVTIPDDTEAGTHTLIARLHNSEHEIIEPQVIAEVDIEVTDPL